MQLNKICRNTPGKILEAALAQVGHSHVKRSFVRRLLHAFGDTNSPGGAHAFQSGCDIDVFTKNVASTWNDAAFVYANTKLDPATRRYGLVEMKKFSLYRYRTCDRNISRLECGENGIAGIVVNLSAVPDYGFGKNVKVTFELAVGPILVNSAKSAVIGDICIDYCSLLS